MMKEIRMPDDGGMPVRTWQALLGPLLVMAVVGLAVVFWPPQTATIMENGKPVIPPVAEAGAAAPQTITSVAQGQPVGDEALWKGFRLNTGWHLAPTGDYGRYTLVADVTNMIDIPDVARVLVTIRVADRSADMLMCRVELMPGETKALICADTSHAPYTSRWSRVTLSSF